MDTEEIMFQFNLFEGQADNMVLDDCIEVVDLGNLWAYRGCVMFVSKVSGDVIVNHRPELGYQNDRDEVLEALLSMRRRVND